MLDTRLAQTTLENLFRDAILYALGSRLPAVASVAALRLVETAGASSTFYRSDDDLINIEVSNVVTGAYRWNSASTAADNGTSVIKPNDILAGNSGRWLRWTSDIRFCPTVGGNSFFLHEVRNGPLKRVLVLDKALSEDEFIALLQGQVPSAIIEVQGDSPQDMQLHTGWRYDTTYDFKVSVISDNKRDYRQAAQGSSLDSDYGTNLLDGHIKTLLGGVNLQPAEHEVRNVEIGKGANYISELGQRRVIHERSYRVIVTEQNPPAPNDAAASDQVNIQPQMTDLKDHDEWDTNNFLIVGIRPLLGAGLTQMVTVGSAVIAGSEVNYAGQSKTFVANSDTYRDLLPNGTLVFTAVPHNSYPPAVTANSLRIGVTVTDSTSVVDDRYIAAVKDDYGSQWEVPL